MNGKQIAFLILAAERIAPVYCQTFDRPNLVVGVCLRIARALKR
jgi:hypothetical protein